MINEAPIKPMYENILVKRHDAKEITSGGIIIPDCAKETPIRAEVLAVGHGRRKKNGELEKTWVSPGDTVIYSEHAEKTVEYKNEKLLMIVDQDLFGIIKGKDKETIEPLNDRIIVKRAEKSMVTEGGIILTGDKKESDRGKVLATGPKVTLFVDDLVLFNPHHGLEFEMNGEKFLMLREQDILGVIEQ